MSSKSDLTLAKIQQLIMRPDSNLIKEMDAIIIQQTRRAKDALDSMQERLLNLLDRSSDIESKEIANTPITTNLNDWNREHSYLSRGHIPSKALLLYDLCKSFSKKGTKTFVTAELKVPAMDIGIPQSKIEQISNYSNLTNCRTVGVRFLKKVGRVKTSARGAKSIVFAFVGLDGKGNDTVQPEKEE